MDELFSVHIESLLRVHSDRIGDIVQQQVLLDDFTVSEMNKLKLCISNSARLADAPSILDTLPETVDQLYEAQSMLGYRKTISKSTKSSPSIAESIPSIESIDNINLKFNESRSFDNVSFKSAASLRRKNMAALESRGADDQDNCFAEVTNSTLSFYTHVFEFLNLVEPMLVAPDSGEPLVKRVCRLFEEHSSSLVKATYQSSLTSETFLKIIGNVYFLVYQLLPSMRQQFFDRFGRAFSDLTRLNARLEGNYWCHIFFHRHLLSLRSFEGCKTLIQVKDMPEHAMALN